MAETLYGHLSYHRTLYRWPTFYGAFYGYDGGHCGCHQREKAVMKKMEDWMEKRNDWKTFEKDFTEK